MYTKETVIGYLPSWSHAVNDFTWQYVIPYICLIGMLTTAVNVVVFAKLKAQKISSIYKYLLMHSLIVFVYISIKFIYSFIILKFFRHDNFSSKFFELYFFRTLTTTMAIFMIHIDLMVSFKRLLILNNKNRSKLKIAFFLAIFILFCTSLITQVPFVLSKEIVCFNHSNASTLKELVHCEIVTSKYGKSRLIELLNIAVCCARGIIAPCIMFMVNVLILTKYRRHLSKKLSLHIINDNNNDGEASTRPLCKSTSRTWSERTHERQFSRLNRNLTRMFILIGLMFLLSNTLATATRLIYLFWSHLTNYVSILSSAKSILAVAVHSCYLFIYFYFDKNYKSTLKKTLRDLFLRRHLCSYKESLQTSF